jgi:hypothetical protein
MKMVLSVGAAYELGCLAISEAITRPTDINKWGDAYHLPIPLNPAAEEYLRRRLGLLLIRYKPEDALRRLAKAAESLHNENNLTDMRLESLDTPMRGDDERTIGETLVAGYDSRACNEDGTSVPEEEQWTQTEQKS